MKITVGKDEWSPALKKLAAKASPMARVRILTKIGMEQAAVLKRGIEAELSYDGAPMKSPSKKPRADGKFAESYKWRYREGFRHLDRGEAELFAATGRVGTRSMKIGRGFVRGELREAPKIRRRIPVTAGSKQLNDTGATKKSIDLLSVDCNRVTVGPNTGHGNLILSVHNPTRRPFGISDQFAKWAGETAAEDLTKGV